VDSIGGEGGGRTVQGAGTRGLSGRGRVVQERGGGENGSVILLNGDRCRKRKGTSGPETLGGKSVDGVFDSRGLYAWNGVWCVGGSARQE